MVNATELRNIEEIRRDGFVALTEKLGSAGMVTFIRLFDSGSGDFTKERREIVDNTSREEILDFLKTTPSNPSFPWLVSPIKYA